jgi:hypothetical protein
MDRAFRRLRYRIVNRMAAAIAIRDKDLKQFSQSGAPQFTNATGMVSAAWRKPTASAVKEVTRQGSTPSDHSEQPSQRQSLRLHGRSSRSVCRWSCRVATPRRAAHDVACGGAFPSSGCPVSRLTRRVSDPACRRREARRASYRKQARAHTKDCSPSGNTGSNGHISCSQMSSLAALRAARPALGPLIAGGGRSPGLGRMAVR